MRRQWLGIVVFVDMVTSLLSAMMFVWIRCYYLRFSNTTIATKYISLSFLSLIPLSQEDFHCH